MALLTDLKKLPLQPFCFETPKKWTNYAFDALGIKNFQKAARLEVALYYLDQRPDHFLKEREIARVRAGESIKKDPARYRQLIEKFTRFLLRRKDEQDE